MQCLLGQTYSAWPFGLVRFMFLTFAFPIFWCVGQIIVLGVCIWDGLGVLLSVSGLWAYQRTFERRFVCSMFVVLAGLLSL
jgi:hypothetical protein